jgi:hypothetical protein
LHFDNTVKDNLSLRLLVYLTLKFKLLAHDAALRVQHSFLTV